MLSDFITFLLIAIGLSFDSFAVSVSCGIIKKEIRFSQAIILAGSLAFFQALFPLIGWFVGRSLQSFLSEIDHWIAFLLLLLIGIKMIWDGAKYHEKPTSFNPMNWKVMIGLSVATSIDALAVGLSFGFLEVKTFYPLLVIGGVTFLAAMLGMLFGKNISGEKSHRAIIIGGIILILIGFKIVAEHIG